MIRVGMWLSLKKTTAVAAHELRFISQFTGPLPRQILSEFQSLNIRQLTNLILFGNVDRWFFTL